MEARLALVVVNTKDLQTQLSLYLEGKSKHIFTGNTKKDKSDFLLEGGAGQAYIQHATANKELKSLAQLWVKGVHIDWTLLYTNNTSSPSKISLPTYPFARERYWISQTEVKVVGAGQLHPLLHINESDLSEQKYSSMYSGTESFLSDHQVGGEKILPGVTHIELREKQVQAARVSRSRRSKLSNGLTRFVLMEDQKRYKLVFGQQKAENYTMNYTVNKAEKNKFIARGYSVPKYCHTVKP